MSSRRTGDTILPGQTGLHRNRTREGRPAFPSPDLSPPSQMRVPPCRHKLARALQRTIQSRFTMERRKRGEQREGTKWNFDRSPCFGSTIATGRGGWIGPHWILEDSSLEYECGICFQIMEQPTSGRSEEGHVCCRACYETHLKRQKKCPSCRTPASIVRLRFNRPLANLIAKLRV